MTAAALLPLAFLTAAVQPPADDAAVRVKLDVSQVPHLAEWGGETAAVLREWHPRVVNLLPTAGFDPPREFSLTIEKSDRGVAATSGSRITVSSHWIEKHPGDVGAAVHELVHVIQAYPSADPGWLTEGIADYVRWAIYEGKPRDWFPRPKAERGYRQGYQVAAGFLLWLEADAAPGIVKRLNTAMRRGKYSPEIWRTATGRSLDELWDAYVGRSSTPSGAEDR